MFAKGFEILTVTLQRNVREEQTSLVLPYKIFQADSNKQESLQVMASHVRITCFEKQEGGGVASWQIHFCCLIAGRWREDSQLWVELLILFRMQLAEWFLSRRLQLLSAVRPWFTVTHWNLIILPFHHSCFLSFPPNSVVPSVVLV